MYYPCSLVLSCNNSFSQKHSIICIKFHIAFWIFLGLFIEEFDESRREHSSKLPGNHKSKVNNIIKIQHLSFLNYIALSKDYVKLMKHSFKEV